MRIFLRSRALKHDALIEPTSPPPFFLLKVSFHFCNFFLNLFFLDSKTFFNQRKNLKILKIKKSEKKKIDNLPNSIEVNKKREEMPLVERNLAILGSPSVGKSALTLRFCKDEFTDIYDPTILKKYSHRVRNQANHVEYDLTIFDTAGLEQQSQIQTSYINSNGFILVYSIVDRQSFEIVKDVYYKLVDELNGEK
jgi:GTPase SAR1 family protein